MLIVYRMSQMVLNNVEEELRVNRHKIRIRKLFTGLKSPGDLFS